MGQYDLLEEVLDLDMQVRLLNIKISTLLTLLSSKYNIDKDEFFYRKKRKYSKDSCGMLFEMTDKVSEMMVNIDMLNRKYLNNG